MLLAGCEASKGLETDDLKITQYKGVEVDEVEKPDEVTDETWMHRSRLPCRQMRRLLR